VGRAFVPSARVGALLSLVGEVIELDADRPARKRHLLAGLLRLMNAQVGFQVHHDHFRPGTAGTVADWLDLGWANQSDRALAVEPYLQGGVDEPAVERLRALTQGGAAPVTVRRRELVCDRVWYRHPTVVDRLLRARIGDAIYSVRPLAGGAAVHGIVLSRERSAPPFSAEDRELLAIVHDQLAWVLSEPRSPTEEVHLSPRQRETLEQLLAGHSIKEIAASLGLSFHTVAEYVRGVYRAYGVRSRGELLARFVASGRPRSR
jgi:DNA-binding CsgD family transcriptional regulator